MSLAVAFALLVIPRAIVRAYLNVAGIAGPRGVAGTHPLDAYTVSWTVCVRVPAMAQRNQSIVGRRCGRMPITPKRDPSYRRPCTLYWSRNAPTLIRKGRISVCRVPTRISVCIVCIHRYIPTYRHYVRRHRCTKVSQCRSVRGRLYKPVEWIKRREAVFMLSPNATTQSG